MYLSTSTSTKDLSEMYLSTFKVLYKLYLSTHKVLLPGSDYVYTFDLPAATVNQCSVVPPPSHLLFAVYLFSFRLLPRAFQQLSQMKLKTRLAMNRNESQRIAMHHTSANKIQTASRHPIYAIVLWMFTESLQDSSTSNKPDKRRCIVSLLCEQKWKVSDYDKV